MNKLSLVANFLVTCRRVVHNFLVACRHVVDIFLVTCRHVVDNCLVCRHVVTRKLAMSPTCSRRNDVTKDLRGTGPRVHRGGHGKRAIKRLCVVRTLSCNRGTVCSCSVHVGTATNCTNRRGFNVTFIVHKVSAHVVKLFPCFSFVFELWYLVYTFSVQYTSLKLNCLYDCRYQSEACCNMYSCMQV